MLFGLSGAHRSGKTTLGRKVAEDLGMEFIPTSITESAKRAGFDPVAPMSLADRTILQTHLLYDWVKLARSCPKPAILDRTPLDLIGYLMAEVHMQSHNDLSPNDLAAIDRYVDLCLTETRKHIDYLFVTRPLPDYVEEPGKPAPNPAYQRHLHLLIEGGVMSLKGKLNYVLLREPDFEQRREYMTNTIVERIDELEKKRSSSAHIH